MGCRHKTIDDHVLVGTSPRTWRCTDCGTLAPWAEGWMYFGNLECRSCQRTQIDRVFCPVCAAKKNLSPLNEVAKPPRLAKSGDRARARLEAKLAIAEAKVAKLREQLDEES